MAKPDVDENIETAKAMVKEHGKSPAEVAKWLHAQLPGEFKDESEAEKAIA
jgi:hypothetical protein